MLVKSLLSRMEYAMIILIQNTEGKNEIMTGLFKERMFDKAIDCILDMLSDTADETLEELLSRNTRQKILYKTIRNFVDSQYLWAS